ncbi:MAG: metal-dependent transcriptional regulator [Bryobacterales bacterium]|nr:metal-dependent transcriptional regulator [Bryobacterales bacterium]
MTTILIVALVLGGWLLYTLLVHPSMPGGQFLASRRRRHERAFWEDVLRQILLMRQEGRPASEEALAGALGKSLTVIRGVLLRMTDHGLLETNGPGQGKGEGLRLTASGERWALHVLRAHRLWESYLADEARLPMERLHHQAEQAEHRLSEKDLEVLDAHLGYPLADPHGDPIPSAEGFLAEARGIALQRWEGGEAVRVVHVEDEPVELFEQLLARGIRPGIHLRLVATRQGALEVEVDGQKVLLPPELLANIEVEADVPVWASDPSVRKLSQLETGSAAEVVALSEAIRGFSRRRLMDFGVTRGAHVEPVLDNAFGDPRAYRVRGATIGIRNEQAEQIWVRAVQGHHATDSPQNPAVQAGAEV